MSWHLTSCKAYLVDINTPSGSAANVEYVTGQIGVSVLVAGMVEKELARYRKMERPQAPLSRYIQPAFSEAKHQHSYLREQIRQFIIPEVLN